MTLAYTSELTLEHYELFESLLNSESKSGRPRTVNLMWVLQAILYVLISECSIVLREAPVKVASSP